ncbi:TetR family transcriptional regulator [Halopolyspora algeriensis]|uniref:TetR family transcriptional regulator n=1 Tax=Halopolyspora algeriensis TaxID=1500506 RepID=A0A368VIJ6_9ACTN|nr:TetR/AcrR family transcriptional regulator [Halopolyspora algeriensis]RCW41031.1 TetR family transcriptional regulator [Halopolyspora algeriensis]TQM53885.1 TetR family transcriptional regulator [Halopolyspora algeriensis]
MTSPAAERGREVRQRLLATAVELIPERGWAAVSTRSLAERAGVTPSVVHYHFPSLSALLNEAVVDSMRQVLAEVEDVLDTARSPAQAIESILASAGQYTGEDPASLLFIEAYLAATRDERLREEIGGMITGFRQRFGRRLGEHGVSAPEETAEVLLAAVDGLILHRGLGAGPDLGPVTAVLRRLVS